jgi:hypothetical protein
MEVEMGMLSFCVGRLRRRAPAAKDADIRHEDIRDADLPTTSCCKPGDAPRECEWRPSFSELIAASSFLDFGGMLDERWLCGRASEERDADRREK